MEPLTRIDKNLEGFFIYTANIELTTLSKSIYSIQDRLRGTLKENQGDIEALFENADLFRSLIEDAILLNIILLNKTMCGEAVGAYNKEESSELKSKMIELLETLGETWSLVSHITKGRSELIDSMTEAIKEGELNLLCTFLSFYMENLKQVLLKYNL